jgi:hypothetical protein
MKGAAWYGKLAENCSDMHIALAQTVAGNEQLEGL